METTKNRIGELEFIQKENKLKKKLMNEFLALMEQKCKLKNILLSKCQNERGKNVELKRESKK